MAHYAQVLDMHFDAAVAKPDSVNVVDKSVTQNPTQQASERSRKASQPEMIESAQLAIVQSVTTACEPLRLTAMTPAGPEQSTDSPRKTAVSQTGDAKSDATCARDPNSVTPSTTCPPELAAIIAAVVRETLASMGARGQVE